MTQEDKELLLQDLCARLPYDVIMTNKMLTKTYYPLDGNEWQQAYYDDDWDDVPYLRPMSSMTEVESQIYDTLLGGFATNHAVALIDWLNAHHFDYRGLIERGLAIVVTKENNPYKE